ncbi:MAG: hypothetical protein H0T89_04355 [Deltaproteobacteria bacterium]|nr:hypothetical protein [Deltaproteobacteria bacterium]MDQ3295681.1 hypothetical protein [Myxococcota bacterium]
MTRRLLLLALTVAAPMVLRAGTADAEPRGPRITIPTPLDGFTPHAAMSKVLYLERCRGNCTVTKSNVNNAQTNESTIPGQAGMHVLTEFVNRDGVAGAAADAEWAALVQCLREVYSPFDIQITDTRPTSGTYHMAIAAGLPRQIGFGDDVLGVAPLASNCSPQDNVISFSFANAHGPTLRGENLCWTVAQESAHAFGLDHSFKFLDGRSACNDPMTYQVDCGGQRFFRNQAAKCGEYEERACRCGPTQNSHTKLLGTFGAGTAITGNPTAMITTPADGQPLGVVVGASAGSKRGIARVQLLVNGFPWAEVPGTKFGPNGQANPSSYGLMLPATLPDGISDLVVRAYDDLGAFTDSPTVTRTKGAPCTTAETCARGQRCDAGKCLWDPAAGEIGDSCEYPQYCKSLRCEGTAERKICSDACNPDGENTCTDGLSCIETGPGTGICYFDEGGCCSVAFDRRLPWAHLGVSALVAALLMRRRRRR